MVSALMFENESSSSQANPSPVRYPAEALFGERLQLVLAYAALLRYPVMI